MNLIKNLIYFINIIIINILIIITISDSAEEPEIKLVNVIFRHGDRTPNKELYPYDPYKIYDFYPMGFGELTNKGKKRAYELGKFLRSRYGNFLNQIYTPELITARTTDYSRTKMSLELVLAGMFPPKNIQKWSTDINWQPIPYTYVPKTEDNILLPMDCPLYSEEYQRVLKTPEVIQKMTEFSEMNANLTKWTGKQINGQLKDGIIYAFKVANLNTKLKRLSGGPLLTKMVENMLASKNGKLKGKKIYLYSGHETNIDSMLNVLNVYKPHIPQFSSAIILELLQTNQTYYVKVLYYTGIPPEVVELQIPDCQVLCPFDKFMEITALFRPSDEEIMCHKT
ncbi:venom acid phosphatase Acph-1-like isoform X2 [Polistes fuscatus]|uniref:venom acid phosphatase Acph-1-like isoform X2 n=1 Tax=Polistes fuscatus TaxID=30207 RepID=UPI001CA7E0C4|nr:venom acid phosphatase Acph-1-like isoform X2 [Polistes fuscatus]